MLDYLCEGHVQNTWAQLIIPSAEYIEKFKEKNDKINAIKAGKESDEFKHKEITKIEAVFLNQNIARAKELIEEACDTIPSNNNVEQPKTVQSNNNTKE